jgi:hypothetical protein
MNPNEVYEMELKAYELALASYEKAIAENPAIAIFLAKPEKPTVRAISPFWTMRGVVTASRRKWK